MTYIVPQMVKCNMCDWKGEIKHYGDYKLISCRMCGGTGTIYEKE